MALERDLLNLPGVRGADISFRAGSIRITFDDDVTSVDELRQAVRNRGVRLRGTDGAEADVDGMRSRTELRIEAGFVGLT
ncbi:MAG: heavy-metal-associated domain-containing protein, partial [Halobacteriales archaeon]|nr:heavy-metal-associated domain-containing protein [Halobacteriales archaeon]